MGEGIQMIRGAQPGERVRVLDYYGRPATFGTKRATNKGEYYYWDFAEVNTGTIKKVRRVRWVDIYVEPDAPGPQVPYFRFCCRELVRIQHWRLIDNDAQTTRWFDSKKELLAYAERMGLKVWPCMTGKRSYYSRADVRLPA
jgi:hypothetical protein